MTYSLFGDGEYLTDVATISGWSSYADWIEKTHDPSSELVRFVEHGCSDRPRELARELAKVRPRQKNLLAIHEAFEQAVAQVGDDVMVVLSDGT
ncbi:MAG TPA: hypothetical protein EYP56_21425 [Planctomycetaceae bacterium]|nr:hypothetical protein [Planctomycetaceae bacterium]HIQ20927.1 hypothetical protein [Planctomycetota bacterium]